MESDACLLGSPRPLAQPPTWRPAIRLPPSTFRHPGIPIPDPVGPNSYIGERLTHSPLRSTMSTALGASCSGSRPTMRQSPFEQRVSSARSRPRTTPTVSSFMEPMNGWMCQQDQPRVGTAARSFRPARSAASSSRVHGAWIQPSRHSGPWSAMGASERLSIQPSNGLAAQGPRISEPVRLDAPAEWGAPVHQIPGRMRPRTRAAASIGSRGTNKLLDYSMLANACHRAGKLKEECVAHYSSGVLLDNVGQRARAKECYRRMLMAAQGCGDDASARASLSVAHNRLGVTLHALGDVEQALVHHEAQLALAEASGEFVGQLNVGLAHAALGALDAASAKLRDALRTAIRSGSMSGEAVACGNLALVAKRAGDMQTARACLDRYLQLAEALADTAGAVEAHSRLGDLAAEIGDLHGAGAHFETALEMTHAKPDAQAELNAAKIDIGLAQGSLQFSEWMLTQTQ